MIERIFIPTVCRIDNQITLDSLPPELRKKTTLVVQEWEKDQYLQKDVDLLVLPGDIHYKGVKAIAKTRQFIYRYAKDMRYALIDDDLRFKKRNSKYWTGVSNMEKSGENCTPEDLTEMFTLFDSWLDEETVALCGCSFSNNHPGHTEFRYNSSQGGAFWIDGPKIKSIVETTDFAITQTGEDVLFILTLLSNGHQNKISSKFVLENMSDPTRPLKSILWDSINIESMTKDHLTLNSLFPDHYKLGYDPNSLKKRIGGHRNFGKTQVFWSKAYKDWMKRINTTTIEDFMCDE